MNHKILIKVKCTGMYEFQLTMGKSRRLYTARGYNYQDPEPLISDALDRLALYNPGRKQEFMRLLPREGCTTGPQGVLKWLERNVHISYPEESGRDARWHYDAWTVWKLIDHFRDRKPTKPQVREKIPNSSVNRASRG